MKKTNKPNKKKTPIAPPASKDSKNSSAAKPGKAWFRSPVLLTSIAFILFCYLMLPIKNSYMLRWYDEMSFFESSRFFFRQCLYFPGGLLRYAGTWLTQLLYYPFLGSTVLIAIWLLTAWLTMKVFRLPRAAFPLALIVPVALLVSIIQIDDAWLSMKSVGYMYSNSLSCLFMMGILYVYRLTERRLPISQIVLLISVGCYFIAGFYALFAAFIGVIFMVADSIRRKKYIGLAFAAIVIAAIVIVPYLYYSYYQPTAVDNDYLHLKGLPDFLMEKFDVYLWVPFIVALAYLLILAVVCAITKLPSSRWMLWGSVAMLVMSGVWCLKADKKNEQIRATVLMLNRLENNDWAGMTMVMSRIKEPPNYIMRVLNNYAVVNLGGVAEDLSNVKPRNYDPRHAEGFSKSAYIDVPINYCNGKFNASYRWSMEHSVQYGKRVYFLKYMVKSALLNGEIKLAKRYNDLLLSTMFHRKWAEDMNRYIEDPSLIQSNPEFKSILDLVN